MTRQQTIESIFETLDNYKRLLHIHFVPSLAKLQLSPAQIQLLLTIAQHQPLSHKDLANRLQLTPGAVSQLLDGLDTSDCIVRAASPSDRRISYVSLSRIGKKKVDQMHDMRRKMFLGAFESLDDGELTAYLVAQQKILGWLETNKPTTKK